MFNDFRIKQAKNVFTLHFLGSMYSWEYLEYYFVSTKLSVLVNPNLCAQQRVWSRTQQVQYLALAVPAYYQTFSQLGR